MHICTLCSNFQGHLKVIVFVKFRSLKSKKIQEFYLNYDILFIGSAVKFYKSWRITLIKTSSIFWRGNSFTVNLLDVQVLVYSQTTLKKMIWRSVHVYISILKGLKCYLYDTKSVIHKCTLQYKMALSFGALVAKV